MAKAPYGARRGQIISPSIDRRGYGRFTLSWQGSIASDIRSPHIDHVGTVVGANNSRTPLMDAERALPRSGGEARKAATAFAQPIKGRERSSF
jgi:hypothetical protein